jgi:hypothetical protein
MHGGFIDAVVNLFSPEQVVAGQTGFDAAFMEQVRMPLPCAAASAWTSISASWIRLAWSTAC